MKYWVFVGAILLFGFITGFSIGAFILPVGVALLVLGPLRRRPRVFWPMLLAVVGFQVGYVLFVPLTCTARSAIPGGTMETVCTSILGPEFRSSTSADPPRDLALIAGALAAVAAAAIGAAALSVGRGRRAAQG